MNNVCLKPGCDNIAIIKFCSRSCAASYNNAILPRRKPEHKCKTCLGPVNARKTYCSKECKPVSPFHVSKEQCSCGRNKHHSSTQCKSCKDDAYAQVTLGELREKSIRHSQVYNSLRQRSRRIAFAIGELTCMDCSWDEHVEVCHINGLSGLSDSTTVEEASGVNNFILLCPNHHWLFDNDDEYRLKITFALANRT